jgi:anaerobic magnesium-protoporphyrin IX monomethyl ester cyclase
MNIGLLFSLEEVTNDEALLPSASSIHFGISFIATALIAAGHKVELLVLSPKSNIVEELTRFVDEFKPRMFGFTSVATQYPTVSEAAKIIKEIDPSIISVIGGVHATLQPDLLIQNKSFDVVCIGEGEVAAVALAMVVEKNIQPTNIPNLWIRNYETGTIEKNDRALFIHNLDALPFIERKLWDPWIASKPIRQQHILVGRGCPFKCTYCSNHILAQAQEGRYVRFRSPENVIGELKQLLSQYPEIDFIYFEVETFGANTKYAKNFCGKLEQFNKSLQHPVSYGINMAVTRNISKNVELIDAMKRANFRFVNIGLESGSEKVRRKIMNRPDYSNQDLIEFSRMARERSINVNLYVLIGLPGETVEDFKQTVECAKKCLPYVCALAKYYPYPGTRLYDIVKEQKLLGEDVDTKHERKITVLRMKDFPPWRLQYEYVSFHFRVFKGQLPFSKRILYLFREVIFLSPLLNSLYMKFVQQSRIFVLFKKRTLRYQFLDKE